MILAVLDPILSTLFDRGEDRGEVAHKSVAKNGEEDSSFSDKLEPCTKDLFVFCRFIAVKKSEPYASFVLYQSISSATLDNHSLALRQSPETPIAYRLPFRASERQGSDTFVALNMSEDEGDFVFKRTKTSSS